MVRHEDSVSAGSLDDGFGCEVGVLVRGNAVWNIVIVDRTLSKRAGGSFTGSINHAWRVKKIQYGFQ